MGDASPVLLLDRVRDRIWVKHYSLRTEQAYCDWIRHFVIFHGKRHPSDLGAGLPWLDGVQKARAPLRLPVVLTCDEVARVLARLDGVHRLIGALLNGTGMRIMEAMRLRVKDVEFSRRARGAGNTSSRQPRDRSIRALGEGAGTI